LPVSVIFLLDYGSVLFVVFYIFHFITIDLRYK
jgi:hypothetical protein